MQVAGILLGNGHRPRTDRTLRHNKIRTCCRHDIDNSTDHVPVGVDAMMEVYVTYSIGWPFFKCLLVSMHDCQGIIEPLSRQRRGDRCQ